MTARRRSLLAAALGSAFAAHADERAWPLQSAHTGALQARRYSYDRAADRRWLALAEQQRERALGWGDQPYGAVLVLDGRLAGEGPSRVVQRSDPDAHAERVAIADAQARLGRVGLAGSTLYSTSRPCRVCEAAAARAGIARMVFGADAQDGGAPRP